VIGLVVGEQQGARVVAIEVARPEVVVTGDDHRAAVVVAGLELRPRRARVRPPGVAEPEVREDLKGRRLGAAVDGGDADLDVLGVGLGELDVHVPVAVVVEDAGVHQLVLELLARAAPVLGAHLLVRERGLRVLVEHLRVRVRRRAVEIEVVLLDVLAVIPLGVGEAVEALLDDGVLAVPQREREAQQHAIVAEPGDAVLAGEVSARP